MAPVSTMCIPVGLIVALSGPIGSIICGKSRSTLIGRWWAQVFKIRTNKYITKVKMALYASDWLVVLEKLFKEDYIATWWRRYICLSNIGNCLGKLLLTISTFTLTQEVVMLGCWTLNAFWVRFFGVDYLFINPVIPRVATTTSPSSRSSWLNTPPYPHLIELFLFQKDS